MLITEPLFRAIIPGTVSRTSRRALFTLTSTILSSISSVTSSAGPCPMFVALLFTRMSTGPSRASVSRTSCSSWSERPTWHTTGTTFPGRSANSAAVAWRFSSFRLAITTPAPASARQRVIALPIPRPPPVTRATLPAREIVAGMAVSLPVQRFQFRLVPLEDDAAARLQAHRQLPVRHRERPRQDIELLHLLVARHLGQPLRHPLPQLLAHDRVGGQFVLGRAVGQRL